MTVQTKQLLVDWMPFQVSRSMVTEALKGNGPFIVKGIVQRANSKNQNGRIYRKAVLEEAVSKYIENFVKHRRAWGELDHSDTEVVNLKNVSHLITELHWEGDDLVGTIEVMSTPNGNILKEFFANNMYPGISSRGIGDVRKVRGVKEEYMDVSEYLLSAFDFVSNPSTQNAFLYPEGIQPLAEGVILNPVTNKWEKTENLVSEILMEFN